MQSKNNKNKHKCTFLSWLKSSRSVAFCFVQLVCHLSSICTDAFTPHKFITHTKYLEIEGVT